MSGHPLPYSDEELHLPDDDVEAMEALREGLLTVAKRLDRAGYDLSTILRKAAYDINRVRRCVQDHQEDAAFQPQQEAPARVAAE